MFFNLLKYNLKLRFTDKISAFWSIFFPIILATFFNMAFTNLLSGEKFEKVDIALINYSTESKAFEDALKASDLFNITLSDKDNAENLLATGKITGYIDLADEPKITVVKSGMEESIIKKFVDVYLQRTSSITTIINTKPEVLDSSYFKNLSLNRDFIKSIQANSSTDISVIYFYSLIAMACILGCTYGSDDIIRIQGNQSSLAARVNIAPCNKFKLFLPAICSTLIFTFTSVLLVILYIQQILKVSFGNSFGYVILIAFIGSITGITLGTMLSALINVKQTAKEAILVSFTMMCSFLSGMMALQVKYYVDKYVPLLSKINPVNLITDGLYSLYYYESLNRYFINLGILCILSVVFSIFTFIVLRRQKYASI